MSGARLLGLDLAWVPTNPSGLAVLDERGCLLHASADRYGDDAILAWVHEWIGPCGVLAFDMPTIVTNPTGSRAAEQRLNRVFRKYQAGAYPANRGLAPFRDGGRAARLIAALGASHGVCEDTRIVPDDPRNVAIEVFPHAAHVRLFGLPSTFKYKKKQRPWIDVWAEWARYRAALESMAGADPPLTFGAIEIPETVACKGKAYKRCDDILDAITCAYVAAYAHRWGGAGVEVFGDLQDGYIVVPKGPAFSHQASGVSDGR